MYFQLLMLFFYWTAIINYTATCCPLGTCLWTTITKKGTFQSLLFVYQLAFLTPGISPFEAISRNWILDIPN